jgi:hypothetical protein
MTVGDVFALSAVITLVALLVLGVGLALLDRYRPEDH